jgi:anti-sigma factor RsiW
MAHLSEEHLVRYLQKLLSAVELLEVDQHLAWCSVCRAQLQATGPPPQFWSDWQEWHPLESDHLSYEQLEAYVDNQIDEIEREIVEGHTTVCSSCARELRELQAFATRLKAPAPRPQRSWREALVAVLSMPRYQLAGAVAMVLMAVVLVPRLVQWGEEKQLSEAVVNAWQYQARLQPQKNLSALLREHSILSEQPTAFGFAARAEGARFFLIGSLYAETLAHIRSGNFEAARQSWSALEKQVMGLPPPDALANYISQARTRLEHSQSSRQEVGEFLARFQPLAEAYAQNQGAEQRLLFQTGLWLVNLGLTAATSDKGLLRQPVTAQYFLNKLQTLPVSKGVLEALDKIAHIMEKPTIAEVDVQEILTQIKQIQSLLG